MVRVCLQVPWWLVFVYMEPGGEDLFTCAMVVSVCLHGA